MKNKTITIILIILLSLVALSLGATLTFLLLKKPNLRFNFGKKISKTLAVEKEYETIFDKINIKSNAGDIEIKKSNNNSVKLLVYGKKEVIKVEDEEDMLDITVDNEKCVFLCFNKEIAKIELYIPSDYDKSINIYNNYGDIIIGDFSNLDLSINTDAGDVQIKTIKSANIKSKLGDIKVLNYAKKIEINADCGDIKIGEVDDILAVNKLGDIKIDKVNKHLNLIDNCGDIKIKEIILEENSHIENNFGDIKIGSTNEIYIEAKTSLGETKIKNNYRKSDIVLSIKDDCGDIKVEN